MTAYNLTISFLVCWLFVCANKSCRESDRKPIIDENNYCHVNSSKNSNQVEKFLKLTALS